MTVRHPLRDLRGIRGTGDIRSVVSALERHAVQGAVWSFGDRCEAIEAIEFDLIKAIDARLAAVGQEDQLLHLRSRAVSVRDALQAVNEEVLCGLRRRILAGAPPYAWLADELWRISGATRISDPQGPEYDGLDVLVNDLLRLQQPPGDLLELEPEMVAYQPTPAGHILDMAERVDFGPDDLFVDVGSGLGHVAILVGLLTGVATQGVEFQPAYCRYAVESAASLGLSNAEFVNQDAREADYSDGTVFFLYTPFEGDMMLEVLGRLGGAARNRRIRLCTYGPCTIEVAKQAWLAPDSRRKDNLRSIVVFESV
jgi:hypothetical protein